MVGGDDLAATTVVVRGELDTNAVRGIVNGFYGGVQEELRRL